MARKASSDFAYKLGRMFAWAFLPSFLIFVISVSNEIIPDRPSEPVDNRILCLLSPLSQYHGWSIVSTTSFAAVAITGFGMVSSILLGWREERHQAIAARLTTEHLEQQCARLRVEAARNLSRNTPLTYHPAVEELPLQQ